MRPLLGLLASLLVALLAYATFAPLSAAPPYTVTVVVTGDDAQGLVVQLGQTPFHPAVVITIGADNRGTGTVTRDNEVFDIFPPNGFSPARSAVRVTDDTQLDFTYTDPFGGGGGGGGGGQPGLEDRLLVKKLKTKQNTRKPLKDKLTLSAQIFTASGFPISSMSELTVDVTPMYQQVFPAGSFVSKGRSGRKFVFEDGTTKATLKLRKKAGNKPDKLVIKRKNFDLGDDEVGPKGTRVVRVETGAFDEEDLE